MKSVPPSVIPDRAHTPQKFGSALSISILAKKHLFVIFFRIYSFRAKNTNCEIFWLKKSGRNGGATFSLAKNSSYKIILWL